MMMTDRPGVTIAFLACTLACARATAAQPPTTQSGIPITWSIRGSAREAYQWSADGSVFTVPGATLALRAASAPADRFGTVATTIPASSLRGARIILSGNLDVRKAPTGASLWLRIDAGDRTLFLDNGQDNPVAGTRTDRREIATTVPRNATDLSLGLLLSDNGEATVRDFRLTVLPAPSADAPLSDAARAELDSALAIVRRHSLWRDTVTWSAVERDVRGSAAGAERTADVYPAIRELLFRLGDHHSFLMPPVATRAFATGGAQNARPIVRLDADSVGYVSVFGYSGGERTALHAYARAMQDSLDAVMRRGATCRWVVDVRQNGGGNMAPMLGGLRPFLGDSVIGYFTSAGGRAPWTALRVDVPPSVELRALQRAYVAVLTGPRTGSSGEVVVVSFRERPRTRFFGQPTAGLSTANEGFLLPDGATIQLTVALQADRTGRSYGGRIQPDELIAADSTRDAELARAKAWLREQPPCH